MTGDTGPRRAAASSSRTVRESSERTSPRWRTRCCLRGTVRRAPAWRWPVRATNSSSEMPGTVATAACHPVPPDGAGNAPRQRACSFGTPSGLADLRGSTQRSNAGVTRTRSRVCRHDMQAHRSVINPVLAYLGSTTHARAHNSQRAWQSPAARWPVAARRPFPTIRICRAASRGTRKYRPRPQVSSQLTGARARRGQPPQRCRERLAMPPAPCERGLCPGTGGSRRRRRRVPA